jgi:hypothetical protein
MNIYDPISHALGLTPIQFHFDASEYVHDKRVTCCFGFQKGERCWIKKDIQSKHILKSDLEYYLLEGWSKGRFFSDDHKLKNSNTRKEWFKYNKNPRTGIGLTGESLERMKRNMSLATSGAKNGNAKKFEVNGITYGCMKDAQISLNISRNKLKRIGKFA